MTLAAGTKLGPYEILGPLGAGGMGEVYRAKDTRLGRDVAIKVLPKHLSTSPELRSRFEREAKTISSLNHPHICTLYDVGREGDTDYLVMELVEGESLAQRLERGALPVAQAIRLGVEIADALARAHRAGIVHRDLKPGNIMVTKSGAKLMDFGLARATGLAGPAGAGGTGAATLTRSPTLAAPLTAEGTIVGTFQYMAPEQLEGKEADARSDLWALGCVLYEALTGKRAFGGTSQASLISSIMKDEPPPAGEIAPLTPPRLDWVVRQCLAKDPEERWQSAADLRRELEWFADGKSGTGSPSLTPAAQATKKADLRRRWLLSAAGAILLASIFAATGFLAGRRESRSPSAPLVSFLPLTFKSQAIFTARFMPDGKTVVLSSALTGDRPELFAIRPEYPEPQPLGYPDTHLLDISRRGELAVLTGAEYLHHRQLTGTLARMPLGGAAPREVLEGVREAAWGPDGENLAIIHLVDGEDRLEFPIGTVLYKTGGYLSDPRVSPDGEWVAFLEHQNRWDDRGLVSAVDRSGKVRKLTEIFWGGEGLAWSRDGREVLFSAGVNDFAVQAVDLQGHLRVALSSAGGLILQDIAPDGRWLATRDDDRGLIRGVGPGAETERELSILSNCWNPRLSGDGRLLLFTDGNRGSGANYAVSLRKMDGSPVIRLGEGDASDLSPDGKWALAVIRSQPPRLVAYPTGPGQPIQLNAGTLVEYEAPRWFPDAKRVLVCGHESGRPSRCWVQSLEGGSMKPVTPEGFYDGSVSPDGRLVAAWGEGKAPIIYPVEGGEPRPLPTLTPDDVVLSWSPGGASVFIGRMKPPVRIDRLDLASGRREMVREIGVADQAGLLGIDFLTLADNPRYYAYYLSLKLSTLFLVEGAR